MGLERITQAAGPTRRSRSALAQPVAVRQRRPPSAVPRDARERPQGLSGDCIALRGRPAPLSRSHVHRPCRASVLNGGMEERRGGEC